MNLRTKKPTSPLTAGDCALIRATSPYERPDGVLIMKYRRRIYYSAAQRAEIWDRWQRGESMSSIGRRFDRQARRHTP
jgi:hypothetical protein